MRPLLIADSGGTKTDWCFVNSNGSKEFFITESYHPINWSSDFELRLKSFWSEKPEYKNAQLHFFCAGCLSEEKSIQLAQIFKKLDFSDVTIKSDLHAAALALYGDQDGYCAILGTGSVFFEWRNQEVESIVGGKGFELGDEGSGFYFGKLVYKAYLDHKLSDQQKVLFQNEVILSELEKSIKNKSTKSEFSKIPKKLASYTSEFTDWHKQNIDLFFDDVWNQQSPLDVRVVGSYFEAHSAIFIPYLTQKQIHIQKFIARPIDSLVDYIVCSNE